LRTDEPHVHEVENSLLSEVVSMVVRELFSPQRFCLMWVDIPEKDQTTYQWKKKSKNVRDLQNNIKCT
jgi:hypothetical protein